jgi:AraC-like DNA-binding protein
VLPGEVTTISRSAVRVFERDDLTYSQLVLEHRLDRAYHLLCDPRLANRSISAIAYDVGFGDLSYFNRTCRRRDQQTPTDMRLGRLTRDPISSLGLIAPGSCTNTAAR